ncbi:MAG: lipocalin family protein [Acidobacteriota bacterium]
MSTKRYILITISLLIFTSLSKAQNGKPAPLATVPSVDLKRYSGKWYEIARYPNRFQKQCLGNTAATYTTKPNGKIEVLNECLAKDGIVDSAKGEAKVVDKATNAKLKVRFAPSFLSAFGFVWGDYWVIDLGKNYEYSVVGDPKREYLWILSRTSELPEPVYQGILRRVQDLGFNPGKLEKTPQKAEAVKGAVIEKQ